VSHFLITDKGYAWIDRMADLDQEDWETRPKYIGEAYDFLAGSIDEAICKQDASMYGKQVLQYLLKKGYIELDPRTPYEIVRNIGRYDRDLGKLLKVYVDIAKQKHIRDVELDEALLIGIERLEGAEHVSQGEEARRGLLQALKSRKEGDKIAALDRWIQLVHREGVLWSMDDDPPYVIDRDTAAILNKLFEE